MLELLVLDMIFNKGSYYDELDKLEYNGNMYSYDKLEKRYDSLIAEFLEPYALDSTSKE